MRLPSRLRRAAHHVLLRLWTRYSESGTRITHIDGLRLQVSPSVFHPRFFGSSRILAAYVARLPLEDRDFLDMGAGSGIVGIQAARAGARVTAVDINPAAVQCAAANARANATIVDCRHGDLFEALAGRRFDVIAWNPPFFPRTPRNPAEAALYAGANYEGIRRFAAHVRGQLKPGGRVLLVLSEDLPLAEWEAVFRQHDQMLVERQRAHWWGEVMWVLEALPVRASEG